MRIPDNNQAAKHQRKKGNRNNSTMYIYKEGEAEKVPDQ